MKLSRFRYFPIFACLLTTIRFAHAKCNYFEVRSIRNESVSLHDFLKESQNLEERNRRIKIFTERVRNCDLHVTQYSLGADVLDLLTPEVRRFELAFLQRKINLNSEYEKVDGWIEKYKAVKKSLGLPIDAKDQKMFSDAIERSTDSKISERLGTNCRPVDLRTQMGPVRDQDSVGWCFAWAAADLASFYAGQPVSALDIAVQHNEGGEYIDKVFYDLYKDDLQMTETDLRAGKMGEALNITLKKGFCLESRFASEDNSGAELAATLNLYEQTYRFQRDLTLNRDLLCLRPAKSSWPSEAKQIYAQVTEHVANSLYSLRLADQNCGMRLKPKLKAIDIKQDKATGDGVVKSPFIGIYKAIEAQLDKGEPIGIAYRTSIVREESEDLVGNHAGVIVGRRFNQKSNTCEFLVRNVWGRSCKYTTRDCEAGHIWVSAKDIYRGVYRATILQKTN